MKKNANYFICFILLLLAACSTEPIETGPFHGAYKCDLDGIYYSYKADYDFYCDKERVEEYRKIDSMLESFRSQPKIEQECKINGALFDSRFYIQSENVGVSIRFGFDFFSISAPSTLDSLFVEAYSASQATVKETWAITKYTCYNLLPAGVDSVFTDSTCSDTLGIQAIIDVFANFPDSLCEELPKD